MSTKEMPPYGRSVIDYQGVYASLERMAHLRTMLEVEKALWAPDIDGNGDQTMWNGTDEAKRYFLDKGVKI